MTKKVKKIGINALFMIPGKVGGTEYYLRSFIDNLQRIDKNNEYFVFCNKENYSSLKIINSKWKKIKCNVSASNKISRILFENLVLFKLVEKFHCNILHSFGYTSPIMGNFKKITTVHDANWKDHPNDNRLIYRVFIAILHQLSVKYSDLILTDSVFSKMRLVAHYPKLKNKIKILSPGVDDKVQKYIKDNTPDYFKGKNYILCVSNLYPHKKIPYLLKLWREFYKNNKEWSLILVGKNGGDFNLVKKISEEVKNFYWLYDINLKKLGNLYHHAKIFIYPSIYEGFGYPVYESMYSNAHIIVGDKNIYSIDSKSLEELKFNLNKDLKLLLSLVNKKPKKKNVPKHSYQQATLSLIKIYHSF